MRQLVNFHGNASEEPEATETETVAVTVAVAVTVTVSVTEGMAHGVGNATPERAAH